jgi:hypothetical protein
MDRMKTYQFTVNGQADTGTLAWNGDGTLASLGISDAFNSANNQTCTYGADDLVRLASVNCGSEWSQTFSYDAFGNITTSGALAYQANYSSSTNHIISVSSYTPTYDANGNIISDPNESYSWDADGNAVSVNSEGVTYDAFDRVLALTMTLQMRARDFHDVFYN